MRVYNTAVFISDVAVELDEKQINFTSFMRKTVAPATLKSFHVSLFSSR